MLTFLKDLFDFSEFETESAEAASYQLSPNLSKQFSWNSFDPKTGFFELNSGHSVAAIYELIPVPTEGQSDLYLDRIANDIALLFGSDGFRQYYQQESPWTLQFFVNDDYDLSGELKRYMAAALPDCQESAFTECYFRMLETHYRYLTKAGGVFIDPMSESAFKGRIRRIRMVLYRRMHSKSLLSNRHTPISDLQGVSRKLEEQLKGAGLQFKKLNEEDFYRWMFKWLSPKPKGFADSDDYLSQTHFPQNEAEKPVGFDLTQAVFASQPRSDAKTGIWYFDGAPHRFIPIVGFTRVPMSGHLSAERKMVGSDSNPKIYAPLDKLPEGSVFVMTIVMQNQEYQKRRNARIEKKAKKTKDYDAYLAGQEAEAANALIAHGNSIFPISMGVYIKGQDEEDLFTKESDVVAAISQKMNLKVLPDDKDTRQLDRYIRYLPMNYNFNYDSQYLMQSRLATLTQIAATVPVYGRSRGSGSPLFAFTNRLGEPLFFNPFQDRVSNAHLLILGTTGSGKSSLSAYLLTQLLAMMMPRMVIIDAGESYKYVIEFAKSLGLKINTIHIGMERPEYTLNPFTETAQMLQQVDQLQAMHQTLIDYESDYHQKLAEMAKPATEEEKLGKTEAFENRDYLMEFVTAAILMITGAEDREMEALDRQDRYLILEAIKKAARTALHRGFDQMIPSDLADALEQMALDANAKSDFSEQAMAAKLAKMAHGIRSFINMPLNAMYFNQRGKALPETDITYFEMGLFKDDRPENIAPRALAFIKLMNDSMTKAEKYKNEGRHFVFYADECHTVTSKPMTAASIVQATKMGRKNSFWIWLATQNVNDFPESAVKAVSMLEYKIILWCDLKERDNIQRFVSLSEKQSATLASLTKARGMYVEGMLLSNSGTYLFRNIPPREILTLAATEGEEHALRKRLMKEFHCTGVEASLLMAQQFRGEAYDLPKVKELCHA